MFLEIQYHPFKAAGKEATPNVPGAQKANMTLGMSKKNLTKDHKGVLTVTLIRCIDLEVCCWPFVLIHVCNGGSHMLFMCLYLQGLRCVHLWSIFAIGADVKATAVSLVIIYSFCLKLCVCAALTDHDI